MNTTKYWIAVVSKDHVLRGVSEGIIQVCHGKKAPLQRMKKDDWVIYYSPKQSLNGVDKCQAFTAIGQIAQDTIYQYAMSADFVPFRRDVNFYEAQEVSILPLIENLNFITDKKHWGYPFRYGYLEISQDDFNFIASKMIIHEKQR